MSQYKKLAVVSPTGGGNHLSEETIGIAEHNLLEMGYKCVYYPSTFLPSLPVITDKVQRATDINSAFSDKSIFGLITVLGGYDTVHILEHIDFPLLSKNKKLLCGYSDITALHAALLSKAGLSSLSGPHFSTFGMKIGGEYTASMFQEIVSFRKISYQPSPDWSDDLWYVDQSNRSFSVNDGPTIISKGEAKGTLIGGNLSTLSIVTGTEFFRIPEDDIVLFIEDDQDSNIKLFDRMFFNILKAIDVRHVKGILIGRFQKGSNISTLELIEIFSRLHLIGKIPIIADMEFGHVSPILSLPYGGKINISCTQYLHIDISWPDF